MAVTINQHRNNIHLETQGLISILRGHNCRPGFNRNSKDEILKVFVLYLHGNATDHQPLLFRVDSNHFFILIITL